MSNELKRRISALKAEGPHHYRIYDLARWSNYDCQQKGLMLRGYASPTVVEIGSHGGEELYEFAPYAKHIWTFEPSPDKKDIVSQKIKELSIDNITNFYPMAVSNVTGELLFWIDGPNSQQNTVGAPPPWVSQEQFEEKAVRVQVTTLDDFWHQMAQGAHITMLKVDTQGHEPLIIKGGSDLFSQDPPDLLHLEFSPKLSKQAGANGTEMLYTLYDYGYICFDCQAFGAPALDHPQWREISEYEQHFGNFSFNGAEHGQ